MISKSPYRVLIVDVIVFLFICIAIWVTIIFAHGVFPGNKSFPFLVRSIILLLAATISYYFNYRFSQKNLLVFEILKFNYRHIKFYLGGILLACLLIGTMWSVTYLIHPFEIVKNTNSNVNPAADLLSYGLGNTLEELFFRGFLLLASVKLLGHARGVLFVSLLFGLFHLQGTGLTAAGLSMVLTTFTMSWLFIAVIYYSKSIWTAVTLHITGNFLLHSLGFDGAGNGMFQIKFPGSIISEVLLTLIYELIVIGYALVIFIKAKNNTREWRTAER